MVHSTIHLLVRTFICSFELFISYVIVYSFSNLLQSAEFSMTLDCQEHNFSEMVEPLGLEQDLF